MTRVDYQGTPLPVEFQEARVVIATPMQSMCHAYYTVSVVGMITHAMKEAPGVGTSLITFGSSILPWSRQLLVGRAKKIGCTHMLWIDSDMKFPPDTLLRLVRHGKSIVAANCMVRRAPFRCTAQVGGEELITTDDSTGLEKVDRIGLGLALVEMKVFEAIPRPWFELEYIPDLDVFRGEDYGFCMKVQAAGFEMYVDHDLSKEVEHCTVMGLNPRHRTPDDPPFDGDPGNSSEGASNA